MKKPDTDLQSKLGSIRREMAMKLQHAIDWNLRPLVAKLHLTEVAAKLGIRDPSYAIDMFIDARVRLEDRWPVGVDAEDFFKSLLLDHPELFHLTDDVLASQRFVRAFTVENKLALVRRAKRRWPKLASRCQNMPRKSRR
jgi:hypothetical protein